MRRVIIGAGQCGTKLATDYFNSYTKTSNALINFSTSVEDSASLPKSGLFQVYRFGSGKKFSNGDFIWRDNLNVINSALSDVKGCEVVYFTSSGGGSGSSSIKYISDILIKNNNKVLLVIVLPFDYENLPYKPNTLQALSKMQNEGLFDKLSILVFDNEKLSKKYFSYDKEIENGSNVLIPDIKSINKHIVTTTNIVLDLIESYHTKGKYTPFSIDKLEHDSVVFSKGVLGVDVQKPSDEEISIKFDYGSISDCKNLILAKVIRNKESDYIVDQNVGSFLEDAKKFSRKAKNARVIYGIIRTDDIENGSYVAIGNNLDISKYINKIKNKTSLIVERFREHHDIDTILNNEESVKYDV